jgi:predicted nucleotidyltransferase
MTDNDTTHVQIDIPYDQIAEFCRRNHIQKLSLFGSVLRDDFDADSDIDVLVEFEPGHTPDFFSLYGIEQRLSELLGHRSVDLVTSRALNRHLRDNVLKTALTLYDQD